jgi:hypothetical protein
MASEGRVVLDVVQHYSRTWRLLLEYDEDRLPVAPAAPVTPSADLRISEARSAIGEPRASLAARQESTHLFGQERGNQLQGILGAIEQTFGGEPLYSTVQARAAHLFYFTIKVTRSPMATSGSERCCFSSICEGTRSSWVPTEPHRSLSYGRLNSPRHDRDRQKGYIRCRRVSGGVWLDGSTDRTFFVTMLDPRST